MSDNTFDWRAVLDGLTPDGRRDLEKESTDVLLYKLFNSSFVKEQRLAEAIRRAVEEYAASLPTVTMPVASSANNTNTLKPGEMVFKNLSVCGLRQQLLLVTEQRDGLLKAAKKVIPFLQVSRADIELHGQRNPMLSERSKAVIELNEAIQKAGAR